MLRKSKACGLKSADSNGLSDPYAKLLLGKDKQQSKTLYKTLNPQWNEELHFKGRFETLVATPLRVQVFDHDRLSFNDPIGAAELDLSPFAVGIDSGGLEGGARICCSVLLDDGQLSPAEVFLEISWEFSDPFWVPSPRIKPSQPAWASPAPAPLSAEERKGDVPLLEMKPTPPMPTPMPPP